MAASETHDVRRGRGAKLRFGSGCMLAMVACLAVAHPRSLAADEPAVRFSRDIRPILARHCFKCHGPDEEARQSGLRLDVRETATAAADSGRAAIVPGKPGQSELLRRISSGDPYVTMPPPDTKHPLSDAQKQLLRRWIAAGANYEPHWAFVPPHPPAVPEVQHKDWPRNDIDHFILARLEAQGLQPAPEADPYTLVRRLYLDLIGLPPTPEEADAYVNDTSPAAYDRLVDRLLASPRYGERWARRWLDLARYADTNGYEKDRPRSIWPYRDWVIEALNADMPFDRFTIHQLAGDMLPGATLRQRIATGFHRNTMLNEEGGIDPLEFRFYAMTDRVATTATAWLGLTLGCAQCHDHKYDPLSQREYYQFMAFLNNADEPEMDLPDPAADQRHRRNLAEARRLLDELPQKWPAEEAEREQVVQREFREWLQRQRSRTVPWRTIRPAQATSNLPHLTVQPDGSVFASGDITKQDTYALEFRADLAGVTALRLEALPDDRLPAHGPGMTYYEGRKGDFFLNEFQLVADGERLNIASATESYANNRFGNNPVSARLAADGDHQTGWSVAGREGERHTAVFVLQDPLENPGELTVTMTFGRHYASSLGRFRLSLTTEPGGAEARDLPADVEALLSRPDDELDDSQRARLREAFLLSAPELAEHSKRIRELRRPPEYPTTLVMRERPPENPRPTFVHHRGEFLSPTDPVEPATPRALHPFDADLPRNRLGFARWLVADDNPLTARVVMNRHWAALFGRGIVGTLDDFGTQGDLPTHPELLDWLAVEFRASGWSLKRMHRLMVTSAAYRQSSRATPELLEKDPGNRLLARAARPRLEAEVVRDSVLRAAGLLSDKMGGPGVRPPQPAGVTEVAWGSPKWNASRGEDRYRRSVYTFIKRTAPFAMYQTFDSPSGETCVARRDVSNTPLQALTLLNDVMFVEAARALGSHIADREGTDEDRITRAFRRVLTRPPSTDELAMLRDFVHAQRKRLAAGELKAEPIAGPGPANAADRAVWTLLARALFALDETITRN